MKSKELLNSKDYDKFSFGKFISTRRCELGISVRKLSADIGITAAYLSDIEHGARNAPNNYMPALIKYLCITPAEIDTFYQMAYATRGKFFEFKDYLNENYYARTFLRLAKEKNLSDDEWQKLIEQLKG